MLSPLDYVLLHLGAPGKYQVFIAFMLCCLHIPISFTNSLWKYYGDEPPHRCLVKPETVSRLVTRSLVSSSTSTSTTTESSSSPVISYTLITPIENTTTLPSFDYLNASEHRSSRRRRAIVAPSEWIPRTQVANSKQSTYSSCSMYIDPYNHWKGTQKCRHGWEYRPVENEHGIIMEWDLVCERSYMAHVIFYLGQVTTIFGGLFFGCLADHYERKRILLITLYFYVTAGISTHFVGDYFSFTIGYALQKFFIAGVQITALSLLIEIMPTPYQVRALLYAAGFSIVGSMFLPLLMWSIKSWRYVQLAITAPGIVFFAHIWLLPQSPLWLVVEGQVYPAENLIEKLARQNGKQVAPSFRLHLHNLYNSIKGSTAVQELRHRIIPKFSSPVLRWFMLVNFFMFFVAALATEISDKQTMRLNESRFADHLYRGLMDLGVLMLVYYFAVRIGPRPVLAGLFTIAGLLMLGSISLQEMMPKLSDKKVPEDFDFRLLLVPPAMILFARSLVISIPPFIWFNAAKTLPTGIRAIGMACCYAWYPVGQMAAPHLSVLSDLIASYVPIGLCGCLLIVGGGLAMLFPSCWRKPLPNTLEEAENRRQSLLNKRYPSYRDIKTGQKSLTLTSTLPPDSSYVNNGFNGTMTLGRVAQPNLYTIPPPEIKGSHGGLLVNPDPDPIAYGPVTDITQNSLDQNVLINSHPNGSPTHPRLRTSMSQGSTLRVNGPANGKILARQESQGSQGIRPQPIYNDDADSRLSDLEEEISLNPNNWRLYSYDFNFANKANQNPATFDPTTYVSKNPVAAQMAANGTIAASIVAHQHHTNGYRMEGPPHQHHRPTNFYTTHQSSQSINHELNRSQTDLHFDGHHMATGTVNTSSSNHTISRPRPSQLANKSMSTRGMDQGKHQSHPHPSQTNGHSGPQRPTSKSPTKSNQKQLLLTEENLAETNF